MSNRNQMSWLLLLNLAHLNLFRHAYAILSKRTFCDDSIKMYVLRYQNKVARVIAVTDSMKSAYVHVSKS